jgi:uncharacterized membrane protein YfcA
MTEIIGYILSSVVGISLGLIGGGGSILTVPILVYVFGLGPEISTSYSLFIVGLTAFAGSISYYRNGLVNMKAALIFSVPSLIAVFLTRKFIMPALPDVIMTIGSFQYTRPMFIMTVFAALMIAASISMIRKSKTPDPSKMKPGHHYTLIFLEGAVVGMLTGFVGAGGGFLIIPALVLLAGLPMKEAVGTSLLIIGIKSSARIYRGHQRGSKYRLDVSGNSFGFHNCRNLCGKHFGKEDFMATSSSRHLGGLYS